MERGKEEGGGACNLGALFSLLSLVIACPFETRLLFELLPRRQRSHGNAASWAQWVTRRAPSRGPSSSRFAPLCSGVSQSTFTL